MPLSDFYTQFLQNTPGIFWENTGLLDGLDLNIKDELCELYSKALIHSRQIGLRDDLWQIYLPCIRRIYIGVNDLGKRKKIDNLRLIVTVEDVLYEITSKYDKLMDGMSVLDMTDTQAETCLLICQNFINRVSVLEVEMDENDPTVVSYSDGTKMYYKNNLLHKSDGPAIERKDGTWEYFYEGKRHRLDGPAISGPYPEDNMYIDGKHYWRDGEFQEAKMEWIRNHRDKQLDKLI